MVLILHRYLILQLFLLLYICQSLTTPIIEVPNQPLNLQQLAGGHERWQLDLGEVALAKVDEAQDLLNLNQLDSHKVEVDVNWGFF